jgi:hypothetical protein
MEKPTASGAYVTKLMITLHQHYGLRKEHAAKGMQRK